ncbi:MAG TPA: hypothetical protein VG937_36215 [Polyangiaceae bacterium]|jgi:hypothetical protein|nr:hypothetical protein [Polyangiaceae bacterium]
MAGARDADRFITELCSEFPRFRIVYKRSSPLCHALHAGLLLVTLGGQRRFLSGYYTVLGDTLYVPDSWDSLGSADRVILLRHERVHLRQRRRYGALGMALLYLLPFFPLGLAYGRARIEWEAYTETLRATAELLGLEAARDPALRARIVSRFTGPDYGWMWPFRSQVERWYQSALDRIAADLSP